MFKDFLTNPVVSVWSYDQHENQPDLSALPD